MFLNGVEQTRGRDYRVEGRDLLFDRPLAREGRLGPWRWLGMLLGIAGTYRRNDTVDVVYERGGRASGGDRPAAAASGGVTAAAATPL